LLLVWVRQNPATMPQSLCDCPVLCSSRHD